MSVLGTLQIQITSWYQRILQEPQSIWLLLPSFYNNGTWQDWVRAQQEEGEKIFSPLDWGEQRLKRSRAVSDLCLRGINMAGLGQHDSTTLGKFQETLHLFLIHAGGCTGCAESMQEHGACPTAIARSWQFWYSTQGWEKGGSLEKGHHTLWGEHKGSWVVNGETVTFNYCLRISVCGKDCLLRIVSFQHRFARDRSLHMHGLSLKGKGLKWSHPFV